MRHSTLAAAFVALVGLSGLAMAETASITGTASYRERIALPQKAVLEVKLLDVSRADTAATVLSSCLFGSASQINVSGRRG